MKLVFIIIFAFSAFLPLTSQNLVGVKKDDVPAEIKKQYPGFVPDNSSVNHVYRYLKYVDKFNEQTLLIFLSDDDVCTSTKLMSDYANLPAVRKDLNSRFKPFGRDKWILTLENREYLVVLKKEEWFFTVFTSIKDK